MFKKKPRSITRMNLNTLKAFRHDVYASFTRAGDALFNTVDALVTETAAQSFAELSLSPAFERRWSSLYEAFEDGRIERERGPRYVHALSALARCRSAAAVGHRCQ
jgi:hypothetical protein